MTSIALREALADWLASQHWDYFVTLNLNATSSLSTARRHLKGFWNRFDRKLLGPKYSRKTKQRTLIVAFMEHINSNFHLHCLVRFRMEVGWPEQRVPEVMNDAWNG